MEIFQHELDCGLGELIKQNFTAFSSTIQNIKNKPTSLDKLEDKLFQSIASVNSGQPDLFYRNAILASIGWNKNDDVFDRLETWKARSTPVDKQVNFMHNEMDIIGHITDSVVLDKNGNLISLEDSDYGLCPECYSKGIERDRCIDGYDKCENGHKYLSKSSLPNDFLKFNDIAVGFVLYKQWESAERQALLNNIIEQIDTNKWFVSMECRFDKFDYAVMDKAGNSRVIARTKETSFLSKYLRAYGGSGIYQDHKIGRLFRDFYFVGKGIVDKPANERSVIYGEKPEQFISLGSLDIKGTNMDLDARVKELEGQLQVAINKLDEKNKAEATEAVKTAQAEVTKLTNDLSIANLAKDKIGNELAEAKDENSKLVVKLEEATAKVEELTQSITKANRINQLVAAGITADKAEEIYTKWSTANDDQFKDIVELHAKSEFPMKKDEKKDDKKEDKEEAKVEDKKEDKAKCEEVKANFDKSEPEKSVAFTQVDEDTKSDINGLVSFLTKAMPHAQKAAARQLKANK